ncbi:carbon-nitrogen hydrolase family protein [Kocuria palustris]|uniref:carbon-nitrogen hydrolase family protein n=1 Tax=Kocuria palustris TaxID=71999 RepID=UPI0011A7D0C1|nr:carbon-nitrogen hydrolase family protein [Kocuria palustris]
MRLALAQTDPAPSVAANLGTIRRLVTDAAARGADLVVFPEESMLGVESGVEDRFAEIVAEEWDTFVASLQELAHQQRIAIVAGAYEPSDDHRPYNTLVAVGADGGLLATYRKLHLYDAFSYQESERIRPGDSGAASIEVAGLRIGLSTCYDLRFPELYRHLADDGAQLVLVPAAWFSGEDKVRQWETLLSARAIENTLWIAAADTSNDHTVGHSQVRDPLGGLTARVEEGERLLVAQIDPERVDEVRRTVPSLANRRFRSGELADQPLGADADRQTAAQHSAG